MADINTEKQKVKEITDKLLIAMQKPEASLVAGFRAWQTNFNRHVKKGERGIRILAPAPYKVKEERDKLDPVTGEIMLDENGICRRKRKSR